MADPGSLIEAKRGEGLAQRILGRNRPEVRPGLRRPCCDGCGVIAASRDTR